MHHLMTNLPVVGTLGVAALLAGPLARLAIDLGAWILEMLARWTYEALVGSNSEKEQEQGRGSLFL